MSTVVGDGDSENEVVLSVAKTRRASGAERPKVNRPEVGRLNRRVGR